MFYRDNHELTGSKRGKDGGSNISPVRSKKSCDPDLMEAPVGATPRTLRNYVDGGFVAVHGTGSQDIVDPATAHVVAMAPISDSADVDAAYAAAQRAFAVWGRTTPAERQAALLRFADAIEARAEDFVALECANTGKPKAMLRTEEVPPMVDQLRFFAGAARVLEGRAAGEYLHGHTSWIRREPIGVVGQVTPWNYPMMMAMWKIAPALAAGNTVVLKPSDTTPETTLLLAEVAGEFLPKGTFNVVLGDRETGRLVVEHDVPGLVAITGSVRAGKQVAQSAADQLKRVHLELGGKAPVIVFGDADLDAAVEGIATAGYFNAGQDCTAATRVLVTPDVHDAFVEKLTRYVEREVKVGMPDDDVLYGPVNNRTQLTHVLGMLERLPEHARIETGGRRAEHLGAGYFIEPTVVSGLRQDDEASQMEIFGPVITVQCVADEDEAITAGNAVRYGLASSVWTKDFGRALRVSNTLDFGCVWINTHIPVVAEMPHGGFKESGYGKDLSMYGLEDYTRIKHVMANIQS